MEKITKKKGQLTLIKKKSFSDTKPFAEVVVGTKYRDSNNAVRVSVGEEEIKERLRKLTCCLVAWWGGGTLSMPDLKTLKR